MVFLFTLTAHPGDPVLIKTINVKHDYFTVDNLGYVYLVSDYSITKYNFEGDAVAIFSDKKFGKPAIMDVANPMKILVFYPEFSMILFLDNKLAINGGPVNLQEQGISDPSLACTSYENGLWVFDRMANRVVRFNSGLTATHRSDDLRQLLQTAITPDALFESGNHVYLGNSGSGIIIFDVYGSYYKTVPGSHFHSFQPDDMKILHLKGDTLISFNTASLEENKFVLTETGITSFRKENKNLFLSDNSRILIYKFE